MYMTVAKDAADVVASDEEWKPGVDDMDCPNVEDMAMPFRLKAKNGDTKLISEAMTQKEERLFEERMKIEEQNSISKDQNLHDEEIQFSRLDELLIQTKLYSEFLLEKMDDITLVWEPFGFMLSFSFSLIFFLIYTGTFFGFFSFLFFHVIYGAKIVNYFFVVSNRTNLRTRQKTMVLARVGREGEVGKGRPKTSMIVPKQTILDAEAKAAKLKNLQESKMDDKASHDMKAKGMHPCAAAAIIAVLLQLLAAVVVLLPPPVLLLLCHCCCCCLIGAYFTLEYDGQTHVIDAKMLLGCNARFTIN